MGHFGSSRAGIFFGFLLGVEEFRERVKGFGIRFEVVGEVFWRFFSVCD